MGLEQFTIAPVASIIFLLTIIASVIAFRKTEWIDEYGLVPYDVLTYKQYYRLISSGFLHGNYLHLALNMITFYFFAFYLENLLGHWQFALLYFGGMLLSDVATMIKYRSEPNYTSLGASGAISTLVLSVIICDPGLTLKLFFSIPIPGWLFALAYMGYSLIASFRANDGINHDAHLWGAVAGIALTPLIKPEVVSVLSDFIAGT
ncbi:MAG: rhomboid family intramembrane serine protease [Bacteroidota bacterium]